MVINGSYTDSTKELIESFEEEIEKKNAELEDADAALTELGVI